MLVEGFPLWFFDTNCWVVATGEDGPCVVIDAPPEPERIAERIEHHRLTPVALLNTHGHVDHVGGDGGLVARFPMPVFVHDLDRRHVVDPGAQVRMMFGERVVIDAPPPPVIERFDDGDTLDLADLRLRAIHTPGHTPGSTCFLLEAVSDIPSPAERQILFSGDHLFAGSVGRTDLPGGSWSDLMASMREKILVLPPEVTVAPGHGPVTTIGRELATNPFVAEAKYA
jgi:glyoxylase-like metal-dependent hydrolase (beta-lactamase superfamily II)